MKIILYVIMLATIAESFAIGFRLEMFFIWVARLLYLLKLIGLDIKLKWTIGLEIFAIVLYWFYTVLFRNEISLAHTAGLLLFFALSLTIQLFDAYNYVYVEEDEYDEEDDLEEEF